MNKFYLLKNKIDTIKEKGWIKCPNNNINIAGIMLEKLLNMENNSLPLPDYDGIELKTRLKNGRSRITLFSSVPDSFLFETKRIVNLYGYPDKQYPQFKVLNNIVMCNKLTYVSNNKYLSLYVDWINKKVVLNVYNGPFQLIDNLTSWSFELISRKASIKLKNLCFINFEKNWYKNDLYIKYVSDKYYVFKSAYNFLKEIENGNICLSIKIGIFKSGKKFGQVHDHGSSFDIKEELLEKIFFKLE